MTADAFPAFLWKGDPPGVNYDPDDMAFDFLEGYTLERVGTVITPLFMLLTVFSGNAAHFHWPINRLWWAITRNPTMQCCVAPCDHRRSCAHSLWLCTGLSSCLSLVAHIEVCQVRFGISSKNLWTEEDGDFNYCDFYRYIIELIGELPDDDREQLLKGWNM
jgi:hypothetical protein